MQNDDGLAGSGTSAQSKRPIPPAIDVSALCRVQEQPPGTEVPVLNDSPQFFSTIDCGEFHGCCRAA